LFGRKKVTHNMKHIFSASNPPSCASNSPAHSGAVSLDNQIAEETGMEEEPRGKTPF